MATIKLNTKFSLITCWNYSMETVRVSEVFSRSAEIITENPSYDHHESVKSTQKNIPIPKWLSIQQDHSIKHPSLYLQSVCCQFFISPCSTASKTLHSAFWKTPRKRGPNTWKLTATEEQTNSQMVHLKFLLVKISMKKFKEQSFLSQHL